LTFSHSDKIATIAILARKNALFLVLMRFHLSPFVNCILMTS